jgi:hypothetical protein
VLRAADEVDVVLQLGHRPRQHRPHEHVPGAAVSKPRELGVEHLLGFRHGDGHLQEVTVARHQLVHLRHLEALEVGLDRVQRVRVGAHHRCDLVSGQILCVLRAVRVRHLPQPVLHFGRVLLAQRQGQNQRVVGSRPSNVLPSVRLGGQMAGHVRRRLGHGHEEGDPK